MIINGLSLCEATPIKDMVQSKMTGPGGTSYGLGEAGYDIRIAQTVRFYVGNLGRSISVKAEMHKPNTMKFTRGRFALASAIEEFEMPNDLMGIVHDKSTWARRGLSVFNTVIEPGWKGFLTLELVYHGEDELVIPAGSGIAQVVFHRTAQHATYSGKYQNQPDQPVNAIDSK